MELLRKLTRLQDIWTSKSLQSTEAVYLLESLDNYTRDLIQSTENVNNSVKFESKELPSCDSQYLETLGSCLKQISKASSTEDVLSVNDQKAVKEAVGYFVLFGMLPSLQADVRKYLLKRFQKQKLDGISIAGQYSLPNLSFTCKALWDLKNELETSCIFGLCDAYLIDLIAGLLQLKHDANCHDDTRTWIQSTIEHLLDNNYKPMLISELMCIQKDPEVPSWFIQSCGEVLSQILCMNGGISALIQSMMDCGGSDTFQDFTKVLAVVKIVTSCPSKFREKPKEYYGNVCKQIMGVSRQWSRDENLQTLLSCIIRRLFQIYSFGVTRFIFTPVLQDKIGSYSDIVHMFHSIYCCGPPFEVSEKFRKPLRSMFHDLVRIYVQNLGSIQSLKKKLEDLIAFCVEEQIETFLRIISDRFDIESLLEDRNLYFKICEDTIVVEEKPALNEEAVMQSKLTAFDSIVKHLTAEKKEKCLAKSLKHCCQRISFVTNRLKTMTQGDMVSDSKCLLNMEENERLSSELIVLTSFMEHITTDHEEALINDPSMLMQICVDLFGDPLLSEECLGLLMGLISSVLLIGDAFDPNDNVDKVRELINCCAGVRDGDKMSREIRNSASALCQLLASCIGEIPPPQTSSKVQSKLQKPVDKQKVDISVDDSIAECLKDLKDPLVPIRGHAIISLTRIIKQKSTQIDKIKIEEIYKLMLEQIVDEDSYIFLASLNCVCALASKDVETILPKLVQVFVDSNKQRSSGVRVKLGEAIVRVIQELGDLCPPYTDKLMSPFLDLANDQNVEVVCSALSSIGVLSCHISYKIAGYLTEIIYLIDGFLSPSVEIPVQRASVHLLRCILIAAQKVPSQVLTSELKDVYQKMKILAMNSTDTVLQLHAELCLQELDALIKEHCFKNKEDSIKILRIPH